MATAALWASSAPGPMSAASVGTAFTNSSTLILRPMTPVDMSSTWDTSHPTAAATAAAHVTQSAAPASPVAALACPALIKRAVAVSLAAKAALSKLTGAAHTTLRVNTPAATAGASATIRARSAFGPTARNPAAIPPALNPAGAHTDPSTGVQGPGGIRMGAAGMSKAEVGGVARGGRGVRGRRGGRTTACEWGCVKRKKALGWTTQTCSNLASSPNHTLHPCVSLAVVGWSNGEVASTGRAQQGQPRKRANNERGICPTARARHNVFHTPTPSHSPTRGRRAAANGRGGAQARGWAATRRMVERLKQKDGGWWSPSSPRLWSGVCAVCVCV